MLVPIWHLITPIYSILLEQSRFELTLGPYILSCNQNIVPMMKTFMLLAEMRGNIGIGDPTAATRM